MAVPIKVSEGSYRAIVRRQGEMMMKLGRHVSIVETVDVIMGVGGSRKRK